MENIQTVISRMNKMNYKIEKSCKIIPYLKTEKKFQFVKEYKELLEQHMNDYDGMIEFISFVFFHILIVKYYTNIDVNLTYDCFDLLMENNIVDSVVQYIKSDYSLLIRFCNIKINKEMNNHVGMDD